MVYRRVPEIEILLLHRAAVDANYAGDWAWTPPAGARFPAEPVDECAARELHEEVGLDGAPAPIATADDGRWAVYVLEVPADVAVRLDAEHDRYEWVTADDAVARCLPALVGDSIRSVVRTLG